MADIMKISRDKELLELTENFFKLYMSCVVRTEAQEMEALASNNYRLSQDHIVHVTPELSNALAVLTERIVNRLGTKLGSEQHIHGLAFKHAHAAVKGGSTDWRQVLETFFADIEKDIKEPTLLIAPNYRIALQDDIRSMEIGPVRVELSEDLDLGVDGVKVVPGSGFQHRIIHGEIVTHEIELRRTCWSIRVYAAQENVNEEALWLIDVATSLLRLSYETAPPFFPAIGDVEAYAVEQRSVGSIGIRKRAGGLSFGSRSLPHIYLIDKDVYSIINRENFKKTAETIFSPPKNSLAERVAQGLGWMTRGRGTVDRPERVLYFFTAIEALLSRDDKASPIVQTMSRHAAVLLSNDHRERAKIAIIIRKFYVFRSALVHSGKRNVSAWTANAVQRIVEALYIKVIKGVDLSISYQKFDDDLSSASYGSVWPSSKPETSSPAS